MYNASRSAFVGKYTYIANVSKVDSINKKSGNKDSRLMLTNLCILLLTDWECYTVYCVMVCTVVTRILAGLSHLNRTKLQSVQCGTRYTHCGMTKE